jgi:hypothetical protein
MTSRRDDDGTVLLTYDSSFWSKGLLGATLVLVATAGHDHFISSRDDRLIGLFGSAATTVVMAIAMWERSMFRADPRVRRLDWKQRWAFRNRRGSLSFDDIRQVSLETPSGDSGVPSRRVVLHLADGTLLPVTVGYRPDGDRAITNGAEMLRKALDHPKPAPEETARLLIDRGKKLEAIRVLMDQGGLSMTEAKKTADRLQTD